jgi:zinc protease
MTCPLFPMNRCQRKMIAFFWFFLGTAWLLFPSIASAAHFESWQTGGGMRVLFSPAPALPMLDIRLLFDAGSARDDIQNSGLAQLTNQGLTLGTSTMNADAVAENFESVGAQFSASTSRDMAVLRLRSLTEEDWMETALFTFTSLLADPSFPEEDMARLRRQTLQVLQQELQEPQSVGAQRFYQLAYGDHPYALHPLGNERSLSTLTQEDARKFFLEHYTAGNAVLAMTGAVDLSTARNIADRIDAALPRGGRVPALPSVPERTIPVLEHIPFASEQAHIFMGTPALHRGDPDHFALSVANHAFGGGGFTSRLFNEVRSIRGLAYSVSSHIQPMAAQGPFLITMQTGVDQSVQALTVLEEELKRFSREGVTPEELQASQTNIINSFPIGLASNSDIVAILGMIGFYDLPLDYLSTYTERIAQVTLRGATMAVQRHLRPESVVTVIVGGSNSQDCMWSLPVDCSQEVRAHVQLRPENGLGH